MFAPFIQYLISNGISEYAVILLLFLPLVTALITFARYIIGWRTTNIYTTVLLAYALFDLGYVRKGVIDYASVVFYGGLIASTTTIVGLFVHNALHTTRIHFLSKVSIVTSFATIGMFMLLYASTFIDQVSLTSIDPITILLFIISLEALIKSAVRHGTKKAVRLMLFTVSLAAVIFVLMSQTFLQNALIDYPEIAALMMMISFIVGKWKGLKLVEFIRFRNILSQDIHDSEDLSE